MHYFVVELYGNLIEKVIPNPAQYKLSKVILISKEYDFDVSAHCGVQNVIQNVIPEALLKDVINEFNPLFFPGQPEADEVDEEFEAASEEEILKVLEEDDRIFDPHQQERIDVIRNSVDIIQSNHYFVDEHFDQLLLFAKVVSSGNVVTEPNFKHFKTVH